MRAGRSADGGGRRRWFPVVLVVLIALLAVTSGCSSLAGPAEPAGEIRFERAPENAGLDYADERETGAGNGNAGVYAADFDRDGWQDLLLVGGESPALYRNDGGRFERSSALPTFDRQFKSAAWVDYDGDGWEDLLLLPRDGEIVALHNEAAADGPDGSDGAGGQGRSFVRDDVGLGNVTFPLGAAAADFDGDGDLDLFVYQSGDWRDRKPEGYFSLYLHVAEDNGNPNLLYENRGGTFHRVEDAGIEGDRWSLAASFVDLTGDGRPDVHVANDYNNDTVYVNRGDGTFDQRFLGGATARNGMASAVADVTGDGRPDVFVTNIHLPISPGTVGPERYERLERLFTFVIHSGRTKGNTLLVNAGTDDGGFVDRADAFGVRDGGWGWGASWADLDNDGDRDLVHATQNVVRLDRDEPTYTYPMVFERSGSGFVTPAASAVGGGGTDAGPDRPFSRLDASARGLGEDDGRGLVTVDYDRDGDLDVVSANHASTFTVYENVGANHGNGVGGTGDADGDGAAARETNSLALRVVDDAGATAYGATVRVEPADGAGGASGAGSAGGAGTTVVQHSRTDFLSQEPRVWHVGLGQHDAATLRVMWPDGTERTFTDVTANRQLVVTKTGVEVVDRAQGR